MEFFRDEYVAHMTFGGSVRPIFCELFGPLVGLEDEWRAQGASEAEIDLSAFDFDFVRRHHVAVNTGLLGGTGGEVIEETDEYAIMRDRFGRRAKLCKGAATIPLPLDYPVRDMDTWLRIKPRYAFTEERFAAGWAEKARAARADGALIVVAIPGGFDEPRQLLGEEGLCMAYYEQPELVRDILATVGATAEKVLARVVSEVAVDQLSVHEDMAGKSGPLIGPAQIGEFVAPYYRRIWDMLSAHGARIFQQDSDGNMNPAIDAFLAAGLTCMYPMEPAAGMDIVAVRKKYGRRLAFLGGIDKHVLRRDRRAIRHELERKLGTLKTDGGAVFGLDHRIPNGTPLENYRYYVDTAREILALPPRTGAAGGWRRMAF